MYILSEQQIDFILNDIKVRGVEMEDLQLNLLDHICCIVEYELEPGGNFEHFYQKTIPRFFKKELKEIQEETTLLLTFKNYYAMKRTMNTVGIIASIGIVLGAIFRFAHLPGANVIMIVGVILISFIFLPLMFTLKLRESTVKRDRTILILGCAISILFVIAAAFKLMYWPGANVLLGSSLMVLLFVFVPVYLFTGLRNPTAKVNTLVNAILIIAGSGLLMSLSTNRQMTRSVKGGISNVQARLSENINRVNEQNGFMYQGLQAKALPEEVSRYLEASKSTQEYLKSLRTDLVSIVEQVPTETAATLTPDKMTNVDDVVLTVNYMFGPEVNAPTGKVVELQKQLSELDKLFSGLKDAGNNKWELNISVDKEDFKYVPFGYVLQELLELQYEIANADKQLLTYYSAKL